jgi:hypothetical protein
MDVYRDRRRISPPPETLLDAVLESAAGTEAGAAQRQPERTSF